MHTLETTIRDKTRSTKRKVERAHAYYTTLIYEDTIKGSHAHPSPYLQWLFLRHGAQLMLDVTSSPKICYPLLLLRSADRRSATRMLDTGSSTRATPMLLAHPFYDLRLGPAE